MLGQGMTSKRHSTLIGIYLGTQISGGSKRHRGHLKVLVSLSLEPCKGKALIPALNPKLQDQATLKGYKVLD